MIQIINSIGTTIHYNGMDYDVYFWGIDKSTLVLYYAYDFAGTLEDAQRIASGKLPEAIIPLNDPAVFLLFETWLRTQEAQLFN